MCAYIFSIEIILPSKLAPANRSQHQLAPAAAVSSASLAVSLAATASTCCHAAYASFNLFYLCVFQAPYTGRFFQPYQHTSQSTCHTATILQQQPYPIHLKQRLPIMAQSCLQPSQRKSKTIACPALVWPRQALPYPRLQPYPWYSPCYWLGLQYQPWTQHRQGIGLGGAWGLLDRVLLLERIFFQGSLDLRD